MSGVTGPAWTSGHDGRYAGRFPLAVERHAMAQVGRLLPGITTVTSHARYYSLHTLVFAEAEARGLDGDGTRRLLRRAEVVVGAVSLAHKANGGAHGGLRGVHGGDRISAKVESGSVDVDRLADDGGYVRAAWGFWGPYIGPEYTLGLLATGEQKRTVAGPNADVAALRTGFEGLFDLTRQDVLDASDLESAYGLCICQGTASADGALLRELMLAATSDSMPSGDRRSQTLRLLLNLTRLRDGVEHIEEELKAALVYGPEKQDATVYGRDETAAWTGVVLRNEMVAGWRNLWAYLVESIEGLMSIDALGAEFADGLPSVTVGEFARDLPSGFGPEGDLVDAFDTLDSKALGRQAHMLARIAISASRYGRLEYRAQAYFQGEQDERYEPFTPGWTQRRMDEWADRPLRDFAVWLTHQLVARAERIALRKASFDRRTGRFKIPTRVYLRDGQIFRDSYEGGGGVALRWGSAFQIMAGLGLVERSGGLWRVSGRDEWP